MAINQEEVTRIAKLARIEFSQEEEQKLAEELSEVVDFVATLNRAPVEGDVQISQVSGLENVTRPDTQKESLTVAQVLQNAPEKQGNAIKVKKVFE